MQKCQRVLVIHIFVLYEDEFIGIKVEVSYFQLMQIEIKKNQIIIEFSESEVVFLQEKAKEVKIEDLKQYIEAKVAKALDLENLPKTTSEAISVKVGQDFNLTKIKKVSAELKKKNSKEAKIPLVDVAEVGPAKTTNIEEQAADLVEDELLAELLDKDLLRKEQPKLES